MYESQRHLPHLCEQPLFVTFGSGSLPPGREIHKAFVCIDRLLDKLYRECVVDAIQPVQAGLVQSAEEYA